MDMLRFLGLAALMFAAAFLGMNWYLRVEPPGLRMSTSQSAGSLKPDPRLPTFQRVDPDSPAYKPGQSSISDGDSTRDQLRHEVLETAKALSHDSCNPTVKRKYIKAVVAYARAWLSIAPCGATPTCGAADLQTLDRAQQAFGSPLDMRVRDAMARVHAKGIFGRGDFPKDTVQLVAELAADGSINSAVDTRAFQQVEAQLDPDAGPASRQAQARLDLDADLVPQQYCRHSYP